MRLTNTLTGTVEEFHPVHEGKVGLYVCGVTPYDVAHVGHAMSLMVYDILVRYLRWEGNPAGAYDVTFVSNYTDVDDKLILRAQELEMAPLDLSEANIRQWEEEQQLLGLTLPDVRPRVSEEIDNIITMIQQIMDHGLAYATPGGDVYFRVREKQDYGKLSHRNIDELRQGTRFEPGDEKEFALDFALWKAAQPDKYGRDEPAWDSPWGKGRPGWHIECSAMARRYLGERFDIHGGGLDLIFPHHENEIAQAEAAAGVNASREAENAAHDAGGSNGQTDTPQQGTRRVFADIWVHNGMVTRDNTKMSKSLGNVVNVQEALDRWSPDAIRLFVLNSHYRAANNLTDEAMAAATAAVERLTTALRPSEAWESAPSADSSTSDRTIEVADYRRRFVEAMEDDLGTPQALSVLFNLARAINRARDAGHDVTAAQAELRELAGVLGLQLTDPATDAAAAEALLDAVALSKLAARLDVSCGGTDAASTVEALIDARAAARADRDFARADEIRTALADLGVTLEDGPEGTRWTVRR